MCLNGIIRSTFVTTNVGFVKFNIVAKDTTMFKDADPILYRGTNNEYQNTLRKKKLYTIYDSEKCSELYSGMRKSMDDFRRSVRQADCKDMIEYNAKRVHMGSAPQPIEYLILWDDIDKINSSDLTTILKESGGSQAGGHDEQFMNVTGVIPILVLDIAPLRSEKPDMSVISGLRDIVDSVGYSNFFSVGTSADTLNYMHRDAIIRVLDDAEKKSKKA